MVSKLIHNAIRYGEVSFLIKKKLKKTDSMSDREYLEHFYKIMVGRPLNVEHPMLFNEKLQWLKLYDHRPVYSIMVDKYLVKSFVSEKIGSQYVIPLLGVWDSVDDVDFNSLPDRFVLKCNHDSAGLIVCTDKSKINIKATKEKLKRCLSRNFYLSGREWPYKNVKPRIIAEEYMKDDQDGELRDYKFFCFNGEPKVLYIAQGRGSRDGVVADFFDMDFNHLDFKIDHEMARNPPHKPINFELMKELAVKLSEGIPHVRVDFYEVNGAVYFGELTFFHCGGFVPVIPDEWNKKMGDWIVLPDRTL